MMHHVEREDFTAEMFSRNRWKQAAKNKESSKNFQQYFIHNYWLHWSVSMNKVSFWSLEYTLTEQMFKSKLCIICYITLRHFLKIWWIYASDYTKYSWISICQNGGYLEKYVTFTLIIHFQETVTSLSLQLLLILLIFTHILQHLCPFP